MSTEPNAAMLRGEERGGEVGFTLLEALIAIVILAFGMIAVTNLMIIGATSNATGKVSTAATSIVAQQMELLKATPFPALAPGGSVTADVGTPNDCTTVAGTFNCDADIDGVGRIHIRWSITAPAPGVLFITVMGESTAMLQRGRSRAQFTTFRTL